MNEEWRDVVGFENRYKISNLGNLKSKSYLKKGNNNSLYLTEEKNINIKPNSHGYYAYKFCENKKQKTYKIHQVVAMAFLGHKPNGHDYYVDHIDRNKLNNSVDNLRIITPKESICNRDIFKTSKNVGVSYDKSRCKWVARIIIDNKYKFLGRFDTEESAYNEIKDRKGKLVDGSFIKE